MRSLPAIALLCLALVPPGSAEPYNPCAVTSDAPDPVPDLQDDSLCLTAAEVLDPATCVVTTSELLCSGFIGIRFDSTTTTANPLYVSEDDAGTVYTSYTSTPGSVPTFADSGEGNGITVICVSAARACS